MSLALNQAFFPIAARAFGVSAQEGLQLVQRVFVPLVVFLCLVSLGLWIVAPFFISAFYGHAFVTAIPVLRTAALLTVTIGISNLLGFHVMLNLRMDRAFFVITSVGSVIGIGLNFLLIRTHAELGSTYAWVITESYITLAMYAYLRIRGIRIWRSAAIAEGFQLGAAELKKLFA